MSEAIGYIQTQSETYRIYANGHIGRTTTDGYVVHPTEKWRITGAVEYNNFGNAVHHWSLADVLAGKVERWRWKNGKGRTFLCDFDHGTAREWGGWVEIGFFKSVSA
jgi:hypothetical protein